MHEYIEKDVVINDIGELFTICYETLPNEYGHHFITEKELQTHLDFVRNLPATDVVEVVRCGECMFWDAPPSCEGLARCQTGESGVRFRKAYDFCSRGRKKIDGGWKDD